MNDKKFISPGTLRVAMQPTLRQVIRMRVVNDNRDLDNMAVKQLSYMAVGMVAMLMVILQL
jgi:hypothetical protein